jgi:hypothetical protein
MMASALAVGASPVPPWRRPRTSSARPKRRGRCSRTRSPRSRKTGTTALERFRSDDEFRDSDLYVFCGDEEGTFVVHPTLEGQSLRELEDRAGEPFGERIYETAEEGEFNQVDYMWPRPGETEPIQKSSYVTRVDDLVCAVGYYEPE